MMPNCTTKEYFRYLPVGDKNRKWGLYVTAAGYQPIPAGVPYPPCGHPATYSFHWERGRILDQFGVIYLAYGEGEFESKVTGSCKLKAGDVIITFPNIWHRYRPIRNVGWGGYWIHFQGEDAMRLQEREFISTKEPVLNVGLNDMVLDQFKHLLDLLRIEPPGFQQMLAAGTLQIVASTLGAAQGQRVDSRVHQQILRAKAILEKDLSSLPLMDGIAKNLNMSRAHFFRVFKEHTGLTPYQYHLELKLDRAKQMLRNSDLSVKQIARLLGFSSVYHFSKFFKNKIGVSPTPWRK